MTTSEALKRAAKKWQQKNPDKMRAAWKKYYAKYSEKILAKQAVYRITHKEQKRIYDANYQKRKKKLKNDPLVELYEEEVKPDGLGTEEKKTA